MLNYLQAQLPSDAERIISLCLMQRCCVELKDVVRLLHFPHRYALGLIESLQVAGILQGLTIERNGRTNYQLCPEGKRYVASHHLLAGF